MYYKILAIFSRLINWAPVGQEVQLIDAEGPLASYFDGVSGRIYRAHRGEDEEVEKIWVDLDKAIRINEIDVSRLMLVPRHKGYDSAVLRWSPILVYIFDAQTELSNTWPKYEDMLGTADLKVIKHP